jgi:hypothetical protein
MDLKNPNSGNEVTIEDDHMNNISAQVSIFSSSTSDIYTNICTTDILSVYIPDGTNALPPRNILLTD